jgi:hypothetical protein
VTVQFDHQRLAETHHFAIAFAFRIEVRTALTAAHWKTGQRVLEALLEAEELQDAERDVGVKPHAAFVGADRIVELNSPGAIRANVSQIVFPADSEDHDPVRFGHSLKNTGVFVLLILHHERHQRSHNFLHSLLKLRLTGIAAFEPGHERVNFLLHSAVVCHPATPFLR